MKIFWLIFVIAIIAEIVATSALKASEGFTRLTPTIISLVLIVLSYYLLSIILKTLPVGIVYAIWSGLGIVGIAIIGRYYFKQTLDIYAMVGIALIILGVVIIQLFSKSMH